VGAQEFRYLQGRTGHGPEPLVVAGRLRF